jgi:50S ribosomal subunit-associated GTPase HflX
LLLHVVDASHPQAREQIKAVEVVLEEIGATGKATVIALNKTDKLAGTKPESGDVSRVTSRGGETHAASGDAAYNDVAGTLTEHEAINLHDGGESDRVLEKFLREYPRAVPISAKTGGNLRELLDEVSNQLADRRVNVTLSIPSHRAKTIALVYRSGYVTAREVGDDGNVVLAAQIPKVLAGELTPFLVETMAK